MFKDIHGLIERCIQREEKAWEEFIKRFSGLLYYSAKTRLKRSGFVFCQQDIEDIVQIAFVEIIEKGRLKEVRDRKKITAWLSIMAQTRALNYMRKKKERLLNEDESYRIENIRDVKIDDRVIERIENILEGLNPKEKMILKLNIIHGKKHREIARFMNIPMNTVSTIIARRKKSLKVSLTED